MIEPAEGSATLDREGRALARYLVGREPSAYVLACYRRARGSSGLEPEAAIERVLLAAARWGGLAARIADGYARLARPTGGFRRRATVMVAILENSPDSHLELNDAATGSPAAIMARAGGTLLASAACLLVGLIVFGPIHLLVARRSPGSGP